jgi:hypothetical protein
MLAVKMIREANGKSDYEGSQRNTTSTPKRSTSGRKTMPKYNNYHRRQNLIKLLVGMHTIQWLTKLDMSEFRSEDEDKWSKNRLPEQSKGNECGTAACLLGHGPACGIKPRGELEEGSWWSYSAKFVKPDNKRQDPDASAEWAFLFNSKWPNCREQCKARLYQLVQHGMPDDFPKKDENGVTYFIGSYALKVRFPPPTDEQVAKLAKELR